MVLKQSDSLVDYKNSWRIAILTVGTILLHTIVMVATLDATAIALVTTVATMLPTVTATPSLNTSTTEYLRRSIRVAYDGNAVILCRTLYRSHTSFHEVLENKTIQPLNIANEYLEPFAVLLLKGIKQDATYRCMEKGKILSETILTIAASAITLPEQTQIGAGDDAAFIFVRKESRNISYSKHELSTDYVDIREEKIKIFPIDRDTHILLITNALAQKSLFSFTYFLEVEKRSKEYELDVGKAPESIRSFECTGVSYDYMSCEIIFPTNNLPTKYDITYKVHKTSHSCELEDTFDDKQGSSTRYIKLLSNVDDGSCIYYPGKDKYDFTLIGTNALGQFKNEYTIYNHENVVPAKLEVNRNDITSHNVHLNWSIARRYYYPYGLVYLISVKPVDFEEYSLISENNSLTIELPYAYWNYTLYIKARTNYTKGKWNKPAELNVQTAQRRPQRAPHTIVGGFHINQKTLTLYWEGLAPNERNGPNFTYVIQALDMHGRKHLKETKATSIDFQWPNTSQMYKVYAKNDVDVSPNVSIIQVPPKKIIPPLEIEQLYENGVYTLKWRHPHHYGNQGPNNYTVFWCRSPINECEQGTMHFTIVNNTINEYSLPCESQQKFAVAANFPIGSSGLYWPTCSADLKQPLKKAMIMIINAISESRIFLEWSPENCRNAFDGYIITYCLMDNETESNCTSVNETNSRSRNYTLESLKTDKKYSIRIQLYGKNNRTSPPSDVAYGRTNEAAPEPPTGLDYDDITSHSAKISWRAPTVTNGNLEKYYIWYKNYDENETKYIEVNSTKQSATIPQLSSGAVYEVWLTAWTIKQSNKSESVNITTMIGIPKQPENVNLDLEGDEYILTWNTAKYSVEHIVFYELVFNDSNELRVLTVQHTSNSEQKHECRLKYHYCTQGTQKMLVRAVNVVAEKDLDKSAFAIDHENMKSEEAKNITGNNSAYKYKTNHDLKCITFEGIKTDLPHLNPTRYYMLKSELVTSKVNYKCPIFPLAIFVPSVIVISMFMAIILWLYKVVRRQSEFEVKLPLGVINGMDSDMKSFSNLEDNKLNTFSILSTKGANGTALIHISDTPVPSSGSESGVAGIGDGDTDTPSTSSEDVDRETLDSFSHSSCQQLPLWANHEVEQIKPTNQTGNTRTDENPYSTMAEAVSKSRPAINNNNNINNNNIRGNFYLRNDSLHKLPPIHATSNSFVNSLEQRYSQTTPSNRLQTLDKFAYVPPNSLLKTHTAHTAAMRAGNNLSKNRLQEQLPQPETVPLTTETYSYVPHDPAPMDSAPGSLRLENEISRLPLTQPFLPTNSTHAETNIFKNIALTSSGHVQPDALNRVTPPHNATSAVNNDDSQNHLQQQIQYGYVTPEFWSQQNKRN